MLGGRGGEGVGRNRSLDCRRRASDFLLESDLKNLRSSDALT